MQYKIQQYLGSTKKSESLGVMPDPDDPNNWLVQGSSGDYEVEFDSEKLAFTCYKTSSEAKILCNGWKFCKGSGSEKQCSHILAVVIQSDKFKLESKN